MCYILFGNVNEEAYGNPFIDVCRKSGFNKHIIKLAQKDVRFRSPVKGGVWFHVTDNCCDCDTSVGSGDASQSGLIKFVSWVQELKKCKNIRALHIVKHWVGNDGPKELQKISFINADEVDAVFLANLEDETLYRIEYFKRYQ